MFKWKGRARSWLCLFVPLSLLYVLIPGMAALELYILSPWFLVWTIIVTASTDTFAFLFGPPIGGPKLMPSVSPKKTWAGAVIGAAFATLLGTWFAAEFFPTYNGFLISFILSVAAQVGDLFESKLKRIAGVKDSSRLIPGHGGVLDRFDSLFFALPVLYVMLMII
jgi:phosphatidate cytidylyltransferase